MIKLSNLLNTTRKGCNTLILVADWFSDFGHKELYAFAFRRSDLKAYEGAFDVWFSETVQGNPWAGVRLTAPGKRAMRNLPFRDLGKIDRARLATYKGTRNEEGHACEFYICDDYNGQVLPALDDNNCRDIKIKLGGRWIICQVKKIDSSVTANVHW
jgi:hypothetical protein